MTSSSSSSTGLPVALLAALALLGGWAAYRLGCDRARDDAGWARASGSVREDMRPYRSVPTTGDGRQGFGVAAGDADVAPGSQPAFVRQRHPLQAFLDGAADTVPEHLRAGAMAPAAAADHGSQEVRAVAQFALDRVNAAGKAQLALVAVESATKAVDPYKTVRYELLANVFSARLTVGARLAAVVVVAPGGKAYLARVAAESGAAAGPPGAPTGAGGELQGSLGPAAEGDYAAFASVI